MKKCNACKKRLPLSSFHNDARGVKGKFGACKICDRQRRVNWLKTRPFHGPASSLLRRCGTFTVPATKRWESRLSAMFAKQKGKCPFTGETLRLGENAHLDHIMPKSRFPKLAMSPSNLQWVSDKYNRAKSNLTNEEFLELCKLVVKQSKRKKR